MLLHKVALTTLLFALSTSIAFAQGMAPSQARQARPAPNVTTQQERQIQACQARERAVQTRMNSLVRFSNNMVEKFEAISLRVQNFYIERVVAADITVDNYDELLTNISTKQLAVTTAINTAQTSVNEFSCEDGGDLLSHYSAFRQNMQAVKQALGEYRSAIKDLIVAVRTALPNETETTPTPTTKAGE